MSELIKNAWIGWGAFKEPGKMVGLLLVLLIFMCAYRKDEELQEIKLYTMVVSVLCICPVTAALLMIYQTRFYDYVWIWSMVPMTLFIAIGLTVWVTDFYSYYKKKERRYAPAILIAVPIVLFFCGGMGVPPRAELTRAADRLRAETTLNQIREIAGSEKLCMWAPKEILGYVREYDGSVELLYGRNMWEKSLNAFTFDIYTEDEMEMFRWMDEEERDGIISDSECARLAAASVANCVLLPIDVSEETVACFSDVFEREATILDEYYLWIL